MCVCENMRNAACSFTVSSSRTALWEQMNSYETKILFSCKYPSVIKYPGNKNDRKMYEVQAEVFPEQCVCREASVAPYTLGCVGDKVLCRTRLGEQCDGASGCICCSWKRRTMQGGKGAASELQLLCRNDLFYSHIVTGKPLLTGLGRGCLNYSEGRFSESQI